MHNCEPIDPPIAKDETLCQNMSPKTRDGKKKTASHAYYEYYFRVPGEWRSNKKRLRSDRSVWWVGPRTAFRFPFRRTPFYSFRGTESGKIGWWLLIRTVVGYGSGKIGWIWENPRPTQLLSWNGLSLRSSPFIVQWSHGGGSQKSSKLLPWVGPCGVWDNLMWTPPNLGE